MSRRGPGNPPEGSGEPQGGAPVDRAEGSGEPQGGAPENRGVPRWDGPRSIGDPLTYAAAGVDVAAGERAVELMRAAVQATHGPRVLGGIGGFAGLWSLDPIDRGGGA
jgi:hypothetical protein